LFTGFPYLFAKDEEEYCGNDDFKRSPDYGINEEEASVDELMAKYLDVDL
jgi:hypothetical protein